MELGLVYMCLEMYMNTLMGTMETYLRLLDL